MKERPINIKAWEVRAILDGRKTQTRRVVKPQPSGDLSWRGVISCSTIKADEGKHAFTDRYPCARQAQRIRCPYGQPGDRLWVRETWATSAALDDRKPTDAEKPGMGYGWPVWYAADSGEVTWRGAKDGGPAFTTRGKGRSSIHMPRWASRLTLEVESVWVERLSEISEEDANAEIWKSINSPGSWAENPWVWVVTFRRV